MRSRRRLRADAMSERRVEPRRIGNRLRDRLLNSRAPTNRGRSGVHNAGRRTEVQRYRGLRTSFASCETGGNW